MIRLAQDDDEIKDLTAQVRREVDTLRKCDSPFILRYLGSHVFRGRLWLMTEFCEGGSLLDSLLLRGAPLSEPQVAAVAAGALCALQHLHEDCRMLHRDLKAANFLLTREGALKLAGYRARLGLRLGLRLGPRLGLGLGLGVGNLTLNLILTLVPTLSAQTSAYRCS